VIITKTNIAQVRLEQYTSIHFKTEEALMKEAGYIGIEEHVSLHEGLKKRTREIARESTTPNYS